MKATRTQMVAWMVTAGLTALSITMSGMVGARGATLVAMTRPAVAAGGGAIAHLIAVDARAGRVFVANAANNAQSVSMLDETTGRLLGTLPVTGTPVAVAADQQSGRVFVGSWGARGAASAGSVAVIDAANGRILRISPVGPNPRVIAIDERANRAFVLNGGDLATQTSGSVSVLDATTGDVLRTMAEGTYPEAAIVDEGMGHVFIGYAGSYAGSSGTVRMLDVASGEVLHSVPGSGYAWALDVPLDRIFITYADPAASEVNVLDGHSGAVLHTIAVQAHAGPGALSVDQTSGRVFVVTYDTTTYSGRLSILDAARGKILRAVPVAPAPVAVAALPRYRRLLIASGSVGQGQALQPGGVAIYDPAGGRLLHRVAGGPDNPCCIVTDGKTGLAFVLDPATNNIVVLDARSGRILRTISGPAGRAR